MGMHRGRKGHRSGACEKVHATQQSVRETMQRGLRYARKPGRTAYVQITSIGPCTHRADGDHRGVQQPALRGERAGNAQVRRRPDRHHQRLRGALGHRSRYHGLGVLPLALRSKLFLYEASIWF